MTCNYLKKKKMFELAKRLFTDLDPNVKLKNCGYRFYRGTEWLSIYDDPYGYELSVSNDGNYLIAEVFFYCDDDCTKKTLVSRKVLNGLEEHGVSIV